jgi:hypothetical protein
MMATSDDLVPWQRTSHPVASTPDTSWAAYHQSGIPVACRDPHVIRHPQYGFILYYASQMRNDSGTGVRGCIAAATSSDLIHWVNHGHLLLR